MGVEEDREEKSGWWTVGERVFFRWKSSEVRSLSSPPPKKKCFFIDFLVPFAQEQKHDARWNEDGGGEVR